MEILFNNVPWKRAKGFSFSGFPLWTPGLGECFMPACLFNKTSEKSSKCCVCVSAIVIKIVNFLLIIFLSKVFLNIQLLEQT